METTYLGSKLQNPFVVGSSGLTSNIESLKKIEKAGAGAVILKSLFEEQINHEAGKMMDESGVDYPEAYDYIKGYAKSNSIDKYLKLIEEAKNSMRIPVIASINCKSSSDWVEFAKKIEEAGAAAIELNIHVVPTSESTSSADIEKIYFDIVEKIMKHTILPISVKIGNHFTNLIYMVNQLYFRGVAGVTLFNRFYEPDINLEKMDFVSSEVFSTSNDLRHTLRWIGIVTDKVEHVDISGSTGVHSAEAAMKLMLAGATTVQVCSVLYKNGIDHLKTMIDDFNKLAEKYNFNTIEDIKGKMNYGNIKNSAIYERAQFMKYFSSID